MRRILVYIAALMAPLLLAGCLLTPGKFTSGLDIDADGSFTFTYEGEVFMLGMSGLMNMAAATDEEFAAEDCFDDSYEVRECTAEEIQEQKDQWEADAERRAQDKAGEAEMMKAMLGGLDPTDPEAVDEFVARLAKQKGWKSVVHRGDGVFDVAYEISGKMDRNFQFPVLERTQGLQPFVVVVVRNDNTVRVDAPGFASQEQSGMTGLMGMAAMGEAPKPDAANMPNVPMPDGVFTVTTDAEILTNNTEEGPTMSGGKRVLSWKITPRTDKAPETLLQLD